MTQVTAETVAAAAWEIHRAGETPSVRAVTDKLGSGSATTVHKYLKQWREEMARRATREPMPDVLPRALEDVWQLALDRAQQTFATERADWEEHRATGESERNTLTARVAELEQGLESARQEQRQLGSALQDERAAIQTLTVERDRYHQETEGQARLLDELRQARIDVEKQQAVLVRRLEDQYKRDVDTLNQSLSHTEARLMVQIDEERQRTKAAEKEAVRLHQTQAAERRTWEETRASLHAAQQAEVREWLEQVSSERSIKAEAEAEVRLRREQMERLEVENRELIGAAQRAAGLVARLEERLALCADGTDNTQAHKGTNSRRPGG